MVEERDARELMAIEYEAMGHPSEAKRLRLLGCDLTAEKACIRAIKAALAERPVVDREALCLVIKNNCPEREWHEKHPTDAGAEKLADAILALLQPASTEGRVDG